MTNTQEAFEDAYCKALHLPKLKFAVDENGQYLDRDSQFCYEIWQSCQAQNEALIAELVEALERIDGWLEVRNLGGLMPNEKQLIAKHKKGTA